MRYNALWVSLDACNEVAATSLSLRVVDIAGATPVGDTFLACFVCFFVVRFHLNASFYLILHSEVLRASKSVHRALVSSHSILKTNHLIVKLSWIS